MLISIQLNPDSLRWGPDQILSLSDECQSWVRDQVQMRAWSGPLSISEESAPLSDDGLIRSSLHLWGRPDQVLSLLSAWSGPLSDEGLIRSSLHLWWRPDQVLWQFWGQRNNNNNDFTIYRPAMPQVKILYSTLAKIWRLCCVFPRHCSLWLQGEFTQPVT